jgi:hypothetical protein
MYSITPELRAAHARALVGALRLAEIAPWSFHKWAPALSPPFCSYLYVASAELLLVPSVNSGPRDMQIVGRGMRDARSDGLIVSPSHDDDGQLALRYSLGIWHRDANAWYGPLLLWMASSGELWLVPTRRPTLTERVSGLRLPGFHKVKCRGAMRPSDPLDFAVRKR